MVALRQEQPMSVDAYLELDRSTHDGKYEYYDGYVRFMAGGTPQHAKVSMNIGIALGIALRGSSCSVYSSDARVQIAPTTYVYPDVTVSCSAEDLRDPTAIHMPVVVFEVLSPSTEKSDRNQKADGYRACASIAAYVLIDPEQLLVEVFERAGVFWHYFKYNTLDALVDLPALGVGIAVGDIYADIELPPDQAALPTSI